MMDTESPSHDARIHKIERERGARVDRRIDAEQERREQELEEHLNMLYAQLRATAPGLLDPEGPPNANSPRNT
jgi:hypothetical protein